jgi:hypothetical protein
MSDWLHNLRVVWMALVVFGFTYLPLGGNLCSRHGAGGRRASRVRPADRRSRPALYRRDIGWARAFIAGHAG